MLNYRANRWANIAAATFMTGVQNLDTVHGVPAPYYLYLSIIEITCTVLIVGNAWKWREPAVRPRKWVGAEGESNSTEPINAVQQGGETP